MSRADFEALIFCPFSEAVQYNELKDLQYFIEGIQPRPVITDSSRHMVTVLCRMYLQWTAGIVLAA